MMRVFLIIALAAFGWTDSAAAQTVTATKLVSYKKGKELLRKINGRWWTNDNREVYPPSKTGVFWEIDSEVGVVDFYHHQPFELPKAESLHLFMTPAQVETVLGKPNRIFTMGPDSGMWSYYSVTGTKLEVRIMDGVLGEAQYEPVTGKPTPVASVAQEFNGRSIYSLLAERAGQRSAEEQAKRVAELRRTMPTQEDHARRIAELRGQRPTTSATVRLGSTTARPNSIKVGNSIPVTAATTPEPEKRIVSAEALAGIKIGVSRADVVTVLGEPSARYSMTGGDGVRETLRYHRSDGQPVEIRLLDGKVTAVP